LADRFAVKRLTDTDLTLFRWHFQNQPEWREVGGNARQKAINLNADVLEALYPVFSGLITRREVPVTLRLTGPSAASVEQLTRKILRQQKNWRLDGELISNPVGEPARFDVLRAGDLAVFRFRGDPYPSEVDIVLLDRSAPTDAAAADALSPLVPAGTRSTMAILESESLADVVAQTELDENHPLSQFVSTSSVEVAVLGEPAPPLDERQAQRPVFRGRMSSSDLDRLRERQVTTGRIGEELIDAYLESLQVKDGGVLGWAWESQDNAISPYDFTVVIEDGSEIRIEVKTTSGLHSEPFFISVNELRAATEDVDYHLYRVSSTDAEAGTGVLRVTEDVSELAAEIFKALAELPLGIAVGSVSVRPELLSWNRDEIHLALPEGDDQ
jgi:hypothetical protein